MAYIFWQSVNLIVSLSVSLSLSLSLSLCDISRMSALSRYDFNECKFYLTMFSLSIFVLVLLTFVLPLMIMDWLECLKRIRDCEWIDVIWQDLTTTFTSCFTIKHSLCDKHHVSILSYIYTTRSFAVLHKIFMQHFIKLYNKLLAYMMRLW